ncbi:MAG TPA: 2-C-methyl-D-erythritol 4-phosphate cytidylyltransferase, partial [Opitutaceae bacterium]|nr:2-C-methyl-D-erythritol 4-phosphate cytidylyltransferase [Opitutaceae bacterium]
DRSRLWAMETPQVFDRELIIEAYRKVRLNSLRVTDDAAAAELSGHPVSLLENRFPNPKITTPGDLAYLEFLLKSRAQS